MVALLCASCCQVRRSRSLLSSINSNPFIYRLKDDKTGSSTEVEYRRIFTEKNYGKMTFKALSVVQ